MDKNKLILILLGIGIILLFLASFMDSKSPLDVFGITIGLMVLIFGFYIDGKKINVSVNYSVAIVGVNIFQWLILIYIFFNNQVYITTEYFIYLIGTLLLTIALVNQICKNNLKSPENSQKTKISILADKTKLILLFTGVIILIGCLAGFILYKSPIYLFGITLGLMAFIAGFYYEDKKINVSVNYVVAMGSAFILQWLILIFLMLPSSKDDFATAMSFSLVILSYFLVQIYRSDLKISISNKKKEMIIGICAITLFIAIFGAYYLIEENNQIGYNQSNIAENGTMVSNYSITDTSYKNEANIPTESFSANGINFNYSSSWCIYSQWNMIIASKEIGSSDVQFQVQIKSNNGMSEQEAIKQSQGSFMSGSADASYKLTVDGKTAYEDIYTYDDDKLMRFAQIILVKNDKTYLMYLQAPDEEFDKEKANFAVILNSFKVQ